MSLDILKGEKAKFIVLKGLRTGAVIPLQFNPSTYSLEENNEFSEKKLMGLKGVVNQFTGSKKSDLALELLFDSTALGTDVRLLIAPLYLLSNIDNTLHAPAPCKFVWGGFFYDGIVSALKKEFVFFFSSGIPARVKISLTLKPYVEVKQSVQEANYQSSDISKKRVLIEGDSVFEMANREYKDPSMWRKIAQMNDVENPLNISFGTELFLPSKEREG